MTDIEDQVFTRVSQALRAEHGDVFVTGTYTSSPSLFPCIFIMETGNAQRTRSVDSSGEEKHSNLTYTVDGYSAKESGSKSECKKLMKTADETFRSMGFIRTFMQPVQNASDPSVYRMTAVYEAAVGKDETIYRR